MKTGPLKGRDKHRSQRFVAAFKGLLVRRFLNRNALAADIGVDPSLFSLILSKTRHPTPAFVGRLCRHPEITSEEALELITAHLQDVAKEALPSSPEHLSVKSINVHLQRGDKIVAGC